MKKTPLYNTHLRSGGKMVEFAGYSLPVQYGSMIDEHLAVRGAAGLFDVSHMGEITVTGHNSRLFLSKLIPTSMDRLKPGRCMYTLFCNSKGGVIDDLFVLMIRENSYYLVVNASTVEKDHSWLISNIIDGVSVDNISDITSKIDIQGPSSLRILKKLFSAEKIDALNRFSFCFDEFSGSDVMISYSGYTGEPGFELFLGNEQAESLWERILFDGSEYGIMPAGLGARDTLRVEACLSLYGNEINDEINPYESNLGWLISSEDDYIGREALAEIKKNGPSHEQLCVELTGRGVPHHGFAVMYKDEVIGEVSSGIYSPTFKKGLALVRAVSNTVYPGNTVSVIIRNREVDGRIVPRPFYRFSG